MTLLDQIIAYEAGELSDLQTLRLFSFLVKSGRAWELQGSYGRTAQALISDGWLNKGGAINKTKVADNCIV